MNDDLNDDLGTDDDVPDMAEDFGLDAEPGSKGKKASGAGLSGSVGGNTIRSANNPDTYGGTGKPGGGADTGGAGL